MLRVRAQDRPCSLDCWLGTVQAVEALLPFWDAWCPDDGRPAMALARIRQYLQNPSAVERVHLQAARAAVVAAAEMAGPQPLTAANWVAPALAWAATRPLVYLLDAFLASSPRVARRWRAEALTLAATLAEQRWRLAPTAHGSGSGPLPHMTPVATTSTDGPAWGRGGPRYSTHRPGDPP